MRCKPVTDASFSFPPVRGIISQLVRTGFGSTTKTRRSRSILPALLSGTAWWIPKFSTLTTRRWHSIAPRLPPSSRPSSSVMQAAVKGCIGSIHACNNASNHFPNKCMSAMELCNLMEIEPISLGGWNPYDLRKKCGANPLCYDFSAVTKFLKQPSVMSALGVTGHTWQQCNRLVNMAFATAGDWKELSDANPRFARRRQKCAHLCRGSRLYLQLAWESGVDPCDGLARERRVQRGPHQRLEGRKRHNRRKGENREEWLW